MSIGAIVSPPGAKGEASYFFIELFKLSIHKLSVSDISSVIIFMKRLLFDTGFCGEAYCIGFFLFFYLFLQHMPYHVTVVNIEFSAVF